MKAIILILVLYSTVLSVSCQKRYTDNYYESEHYKVWNGNGKPLVELIYLDTMEVTYIAKYYSFTTKKLILYEQFNGEVLFPTLMSYTTDKGTQVEIGKILFNEYLKYKYRTYGYEDDRADIVQLSKEMERSEFASMIEKDVKQVYQISFTDFEITCLISYFNTVPR